MVGHFKRLVLLCPLAVVLSLGVNVLEAGGKGHKEVKISHVVSKPDADGKQKVTVTIAVEKGWYLYANPVANEAYADAATLIKAKGATIRVEYPEGKLKVEVDEKTGVETRFQTYQDRVEIVGEVQRQGDGPVILTVHYNCCNGKLCYPRDRVNIKLE